MTKRKPFWILRIDSEDEAKKIIAEVAWLFIGLGVLTIILSLFLPDQISILDGAAYFLLGTLLGLKRNFWVAIILLLLSGISIFSTAYSALTGVPGGRNILLSIIVFYAAVQALLASWYLKKGAVKMDSGVLTRSERWGTKAFPWLIWISSIIFVIVICLIILGNMVDPSLSQ